MKTEIDQEWEEILPQLENKFGQGLDVQSIIFLVGVQELGKGYRDFTKDEKIDIMHIAICSLLEPYGYYKYIGNDEEGWPHFEKLQETPPLGSGQQLRLMKTALINYFRANDLL